MILYIVIIKLYFFGFMMIIIDIHIYIYNSTYYGENMTNRMQEESRIC